MLHRPQLKVARLYDKTCCNSSRLQRRPGHVQHCLLRNTSRASRESQAFMSCHTLSERLLTRFDQGKAQKCRQSMCLAGGDHLVLKMLNRTNTCALQEVTICEDCFSVTGPRSPSLAFFNQVDGSNSTYQLMVGWEPTYRGGITIGLQSAR